VDKRQKKLYRKSEKLDKKIIKRTFVDLIQNYALMIVESLTKENRLWLKSLSILLIKTT